MTPNFGVALMRLALSAIVAAALVGCSSGEPAAWTSRDQGRPPQAPAQEVTVVVETSSAKAVLKALMNPRLNHAEALLIAQSDGNAAMIRKSNAFVQTNAADFADALVAAAHGVDVSRPSETVFEFGSLRPRVAQLLQLTAQIESRPGAFQTLAQHRAALYAPPGLALSLTAHVIAGGPAGSFAFGDADFYLNVGYQDDIGPAAAGHDP